MTAEPVPTSPWREAISVWFAQLTDAINAVATAVENAEGEADAEAVAYLLAGLRDAKEALALVDSLVESTYARLAPKFAVVDGVGSFEVKSGKDRKAWDHEALASQVAARAADDCYYDRETGEVFPPAVAADRVVRRLLTCAGVAYWKVGGCRELGIDLDDYCTVEPGRRSVIYRKAGK